MRVNLYGVVEDFRSAKDEIEKSVLSVLESGNYLKGPYVKAFEEAFGSYIGSKNVVAVDSGTSALSIAITAALGDPKRCRIAIPSFSFVATMNAITSIGGVPVFVDVDDFYGMSADSLRRVIDDHPVDAVIIAHLFGGACRDINEIAKMCRKHDIPLIEDCAQAFGCTIYRGDGGAIENAGLAGDMSTFSFYPTKNLSCAGDGGAIVVPNDKEDEFFYSRTCRALREHGIVEHGMIHGGGNGRMDEMQAAILIAKMGHDYKTILNKISRRKDIAHEYNSRISKHLVMHNEEKNVTMCNSYSQYVLQIGDGKRDQFSEYMAQNGISTAVYYDYTLPEMYIASGEPFNSKYSNDKNAHRISRSIISIPVHPFMKDEEVDYVIDTINRWE